jgi:hypothetical protein
MKIVHIHRNVMSGQCKGSLLRLQIRHTAIFFFPWFRGWSGSHIGLFVPRKVNGYYRCTGFRFRPWFASDIAVNRLPNWYVKTMNFLTFSNF